MYYCMSNMEQAGKSILVIDDNEDMLATVSLILRKNGYAVTGKAQFDELESELIAIAPDLILIDRTLGWIDGRQLCKQIRSFAAFSNTIILLFSAYSVSILKIVQKLAQMASSKSRLILTAFFTRLNNICQHNGNKTDCFGHRCQKAHQHWGMGFLYRSFKVTIVSANFRQCSAVTCWHTQFNILHRQFHLHYIFMLSASKCEQHAQDRLRYQIHNIERFDCRSPAISVQTRNYHRSYTK